MKRWLRRVRGAVLMGLTWAVLWAPVGPLIGMIVDADGSMDEPWVLVGALPGLFGGVAFAIVLGVVARHRRFAELSLPRFAAWGAAAGLLLGTLWSGVVMVSDGTPGMLGGVVIGSLTLLSAASAVGSLALARLTQRRDAPAGGPDAVAAAADDPGLLGKGDDLPAWTRSAARAAQPTVDA